MGAGVAGILSDGNSTSLEALGARYLGARYSGTRRVLATGFPSAQRPLGFPVPGYLAGIRPSSLNARLAGLTPGGAPPSLASAGTERPPDLPSSCSSLRDLNCTHSNYKTQKSPVSVFIVTTSPCRDWVICAPAAFLGCGSRFSGSLSGIEP